LAPSYGALEIVGLLLLGPYYYYYYYYYCGDKDLIGVMNTADRPERLPKAIRVQNTPFNEITYQKEENKFSFSHHNY